MEFIPVASEHQPPAWVSIQGDGDNTHAPLLPGSSPFGERFNRSETRK
jgi:hypothetical protein